MSSTDYTLAGTYTIKMIATLDDAASAFNDEVEFDVVVTNCASVTITAIQDISDISYSIGDTDTELTLNAATLSDSTCANAITYTVVNSDGSALDNPPFTFDDTTMKLTIESLTDSSMTGSYNLKFIATNSHSGGTISSEDAFSVDVICDIDESYTGTTSFTY